MIATEISETVKLKDSETLAALMERHGYSVRSLAEEASRELRKKRIRNRSGNYKSIGHGTVGNLRSGYRNTCDPDAAKVIAELLDQPFRVLFTVKLSNVKREVGRKQAA